MEADLTLLLREATASLAALGAGNPRFEAELLLSEALGRPRLFLFTERAYQPRPQEAARFDELLGRRLAGEPLQYVLGTAAFRHLLLRVGPGLLIPRSETEVLVEIAWHALLPRLAHSAAAPFVVDVGIGSGAILLALLDEARRAKRAPRGWRPLGIDLSARALAATRENALLNKLPVPPLVQGNLLAAFDPAAPVAAIVSNPPYVATAEMAALPPEIREHEPPLALAGGDDGLAVIRLLLDQARPFVARGALLCFEIGGHQEPGVRRELESRDLSSAATIHPDLVGRPRVVLIAP